MNPNPYSRLRQPITGLGWLTAIRQLGDGPNRTGFRVRARSNKDGH